MKTECPHCHTRFNIADEHKGKRTKCPKCKGAFVIVPFIENRPREVCSRCGREIGRFEQTFVFGGKIVCGECDRRIRNDLETVTPSPVEQKEKEHVPSMPNRDKRPFGAYVMYFLSISTLVFAFWLFFETDSNLILGLFFLVVAILCAISGWRYASAASKEEYHPKRDICFFCQNNAAHEEAFYPSPMFKVIDTKKGWGGTINRMDGALIAVALGKIIYYQVMTEKVPRCEQCKSWHDRNERYKKKSYIIGAIAGASLAILCVLVARGFRPSNLLVALIAGGVGSIFGVLIGPFFAFLIARKPSGVQVISYHKQFPGIKQLETQGWKLGIKPVAELYDDGTLNSSSLARKRVQSEIRHILSSISKSGIVFFLMIQPMRSMQDEAKVTFRFLEGVIGIIVLVCGVCQIVLSFLIKRPDPAVVQKISEQKEMSSGPEDLTVKKERKTDERGGADGFVRFACSCGKRVKVASKYVGQSVRCPHCGQIIKTPQK
jgi:predicted Zn finger-like uncharacterized protein